MLDALTLLVLLHDPRLLVCYENAPVLALDELSLMVRGSNVSFFASASWHPHLASHFLHSALTFTPHTVPPPLTSLCSAVYEPLEMTQRWEMQYYTAHACGSLILVFSCFLDRAHECDGWLKVVSHP